jgi:chaperonin GroES
VPSAALSGRNEDVGRDDPQAPIGREVNSMAKESNKQTSRLERIEPVGKRVVIRKDEDKKQTKGGIQLPDNLEIPTITGRIVAISAEIEKDENLPLRQYDKILFNPKHAIPVELEPGNQLFVVPVEDIVAVFRRE